MAGLIPRRQEATTPSSSGATSPTNDGPEWRSYPIEEGDLSPLSTSDTDLAPEAVNSYPLGEDDLDSLHDED